MSMPADFIALIEADTAVAAIIDDRIHPNLVPGQVWDGDNKRPSVCYFWQIDPPERTFCGTDDLRHSRFTIHCAAADYDTTVGLADATEAAVLDYSGVSGGTEIQTVSLDMAADTGPDEDPGLFTRTLMFSVWHNRSE